ncbi:MULTISPECIES: hypothetical protein [unclassified Streptomyces]|uniref:hypothetical protein n=1 Tax=unclassified Streptomyces TaxID=2593676 RepID=UPI002DDBB894|nr:MULTISPECIES: hypothetical protein [unclassified Streptomyces]WSF89350.1 hypothetical protein OIE70_43510 [Streptomyces sp. NBC_01744]WSC34484.1 hypothetical protein OHA08_02410 [Streptomyces sp. NBC_01763]WSC42899.1 hypothetical protein OIE61_02290 [Streptomyces sp. NBC_01762]WSC58245.1 hypothetical protein OG808_41940 [Streptomyces sp. NBC_01761]WSD22432.1 hypothetical protein OHA26_02325 [Streptomyces sp. NBC_01751]
MDRPQPHVRWSAGSPRPVASAKGHAAGEQRRRGTQLKFSDEELARIKELLKAS